MRMQRIKIANIVTSREVHSGHVSMIFMKNNSFQFCLKFNFEFIFQFFHNFFAIFSLVEKSTNENSLDLFVLFRLSAHSVFHRISLGRSESCFRQPLQLDLHEQLYQQ